MPCVLFLISACDVPERIDIVEEYTAFELYLRNTNT